MDYSKLSIEQLQEELNVLETKYQKMRKLALNVAKEMDALSEQFVLVNEEIKKRN